MKGVRELLGTWQSRGVEQLRLTSNDHESREGLGAALALWVIDHSETEEIHGACDTIVELVVVGKQERSSQDHSEDSSCHCSNSAGKSD
jgi:hypothetical protein